MLLNELHVLRDAIRTLGQKYRARSIRVFGSVARREDRLDSDVDFPRCHDMFTQRMPLDDQLTLLLNRRVELLREHKFSHHIQEQVVHEVVDLRANWRRYPEIKDCLGMR